MTEVLRCCGKRFQEIAFLLSVDVDRLMEEEAHLINVSITANHRSYTRLCKHLCLGAVHIYTQGLYSHQ